ncbi:MAG: hypothetical protein Q8R18_05615, partial [bacterium]|nr:hypothetical protein [bacterium]
MPSKYEREQAYVQLRDMSEDLKTLKDTHDEFVRTQEYTQKNPPGPLEVEIDTTALERYSENQALELETISDDIGSMDSSLEYMNDTLDSIEFYSRMGLPILANTCLAIRKGNKHLKNISEMQELACDYLGEIGDQLGNVTEGIDTINENLGYLAEGLETIIDNQERQYELTERIGRAFKEGLLEISQDLNNIYLQQQYQT